jgi:proteasome-associated ATPase
MASDTNQSLELLDKLAEAAPKDNQRLQNMLVALRTSLLAENKNRAEAEKLLSEYEEAYNKLTAPANRIGVFLEWLEEEQLALMAVGDQEFVARVDPKLDQDALTTGIRVKVNDAYAVVGSMAPAISGGMIVPTSA